MNYYGRYGLEYNPFIKNSNKEIINTSDLNEADIRLNFLLNNKGFGLLTGSPGKGKTTVIRNWVKSLNTSLYKVIYISLSTITVQEFYRTLALELGVEPKFRKNDNFKLIQGEINRLSIEKRITPIIILDEANYISSSILNDLKIIFNFDMDSKDRAIILLAGLPMINNTLRLSHHEPLRQRITMNYNLTGLNKEEAKNYILNKLQKAGSKDEIFSENALEAIINYSNGTPRLIDKICNNCLLIGDNQGVDTINNDIVMNAVNEVELS